jgi:serine/threonine protein kinase
MELLEGQTLKQRIASGRIPNDELIRIALQVSNALETAHSRGLVHRDIKLMAVGITAGTVFQPAAPRELVQLANGEGPADVARDGRILQAVPLDKDAQAAFTVILDWQAAMKK